MKKWTIRDIVAAVLILGIFAGLVTTWTVYGEDISDNTENITALDTIVADPKEGLTINQVLIQKDIEIIQTAQIEIKADQKAMLVEQRAGFKEIMAELKEKKP